MEQLMNLQHLFSRARLSVSVVVVAAALSACASAPIPEQQISLSKEAVNRAVSADATQYAPLEMKAAQDKMFLMERALGEKNYPQAKLLAEQIEADANLAERKARAVKWQKQLTDARSGIQVLKQEMLQDPVTGFNPPASAQ
ncbi:chromosome segregation ATPase [Pseudomonas fluorescens]|uniref:Chromosome segregation ATPase n=2 Tax=Pseudomonas fluorescens TaxID=294 RepID=A0A423MK64_PSEFL|nr:chromosome segregation ATPase [Pseudomonas fluorescens]